MNEIKQEQMIFTLNEQERMIFTIHEWEQVHKWKQMILWYAHFQALMRNDQEMTKIEWEILFMTVNNQYHLFSFAIHDT